MNSSRIELLWLVWDQSIIQGPSSRMELINHKNVKTYAITQRTSSKEDFAKFQNACKSEFKWCQASSKGPVFSVLR